MEEKVKELLEKQLELLSEQSASNDEELPQLSRAMVEIASLLLNLNSCNYVSSGNSITA